MAWKVSFVSLSILGGCRLGVKSAGLHEVYSPAISQALKSALQQFEQKLPGFVSDAGLLHGVETRTSSPVCCAVLCCAVLRCAALRCAVLRCAVLCCADLHSDCKPTNLSQEEQGVQTRYLSTFCCFDQRKPAC